MESHSPSLGDQFARLRDTAQAQERCAWFPAALHALIMACLVRLFGRLEQIFQLWQAGNLPLPAPRRESRQIAPRDPQSPAPRAWRRTRRRTRRHSRARATARQSSPAPRPAIPPADIAPTGTLAPSIRPRSARAPPSPHAPVRRDSPPWRGRATAPIIVSISKL